MMASGTRDNGASCEGIMKRCRSKYLVRARAGTSKYTVKYQGSSSTPVLEYILDRGPSDRVYFVIPGCRSDLTV